MQSLLVQFFSPSLLTCFLHLHFFSSLYNHTADAYIPICLLNMCLLAKHLCVLAYMITTNSCFTVGLFRTCPITMLPFHLSFFFSSIKGAVETNACLMLQTHTSSLQFLAKYFRAFCPWGRIQLENGFKNAVTLAIL